MPTLSRAEAKAKRLKEEREATAAAKAKFVNYFFVVGCAKGIKPAPGKSVNADDPFATAYEGALLDCFPAPTKHQPFPDHIWMFCLPRGLFFRPTDDGVSCFPFVLTNTTGFKLYGYCLTYYELVPPEILKSLGIPARAPVYSPKCLCTLSHWPFWSTYRQWLSELHELTVRRRGLGVAVEQLIFNMLVEVPLPPPGKAVEFALGDRRIRAATPSKDDFPLCDVPINMLFKCLDINTVIRIFQHLLLEGRVLFHSQHYSLLGYACEAFRAFLYPFQWHHVYVPVLSEALAEFPAYTPTPFIMGVGASYLESVLDLIKQQDQLQELVLVDLDSGSVMGPGFDVDFPELETVQLKKDLKSVLYADIMRVDSPEFDPYTNPPRNPADVDRRIRLAFFRYFVSMFKYYRQFLVYVRVVPTPIAVFNTESFGTLRPENLDFLEAFMETQAFMVFLEEHNWPRPNLFDAWIDSEAYKLSFDELVARYCSPNANVFDVVKVAFVASIPPPESGSTDGFPRLRMKLLEAAQASVARPSLDAKVLRSSSETRYAEQSLHQSTEGIYAIEALERTRNRDEKDKVAALVAKLLSRAHSAERPLDESEANQLQDLLQVAYGWKEFAAQLAQKRTVENKKADRELSRAAFVQLLDLINSALRHCQEHDDVVTPRTLLGPLFIYFEVQNGASEYLYAGVRSAPVWQTSNFWEKAMYDCLTTEYRKRYGEIRGYMERWPLLSQADQDAASSGETDAIFMLLTEFAFKMVNMHTKVDIIRKFMTRMCSLTSLDDERSIQLGQLLSNMIMAQSLMDKSEMKNEADMGLAYSDTPGFMLVDASTAPQTSSFLQTFVEEKTRQLLGSGGVLRKMRNQFVSEFSSAVPRKRSVRTSDSAEYR
eukprot:TRINITY_DN19489_c0_g1_i1.p1 TRINITY_DN19489_c0_g1~~TRINITY_DN19489_c0_g1_i1.p1  ORF type:complete len:882 (+),score=343.51 TRINITY_DN19489_c0_g1_i1:288-2933(+)